jgi:hypothetical protein
MGLTIEQGVRDSIKQVQEALAAQFADKGYKVDEVSISLHMRAISKDDESIVLTQQSVAIVGLDTDNERVIKAKPQGQPGPQGPQAVPPAQ